MPSPRNLTNSPKILDRDQINEPATKHIEVFWSVVLLTRRDGGGEEIEFFSEAAVAAYNADPDGFAAKHFGLADAEEYREWVASNGAPRCSERTKSGKPCNTQVGKNHGVEYWRQHHRVVPCSKHGGEPLNTGPMPPTSERRYGRSRYPIAGDRRCQAITKPPDYWNRQAWTWGPHQCGMSGTFERNGRRVCHVHRDCAEVTFVEGGRS